MTRRQPLGERLPSFGTCRRGPDGPGLTRRQPPVERLPSFDTGRREPEGPETATAELGRAARKCKIGPAMPASVHGGGL